MMWLRQRLKSALKGPVAVLAALALAGMATSAGTAAAAPLDFGGLPSPGATQETSRTGHTFKRMPNHVPTKAKAGATKKGHLTRDTKVALTFILPLRNKEQLKERLSRIYDPSDPLHGHYLTSQEFADNYGPTQADYEAVAAHAKSVGLTVTKTHPNRTLLNVSGSSGQVEAAFNVQLDQYQGNDGREFYAPDRDPEVPVPVASRISGVLGLDNATTFHPHANVLSAAKILKSSPRQIGSGPGGGLTPSEILQAYNLSGIQEVGAGQTLALFELASYNPVDVAQYVSHYGLTPVPLQDVFVDGGPLPSECDTPDPNSLEVALDIELQMAVAPGASKIMVYQGPNTVQGVLDTYNAIATDNLASQVSTSWGIAEEFTTEAWREAENSIFQQMAAQGQSIFAASGDSGAYDNSPHTVTPSLSVDDPAAQPFMVAVGGTTLSLNADHSYGSESSWVDILGGWLGGGGGVSSVWSTPNWQMGVPNATSTTMRNVPDVALNSDLNTGYSIYWDGDWYIAGGTSCASPIWAAFTARVNQARATLGYPTLGFANPRIYQIATGPNYGADFNDIADGSNNYYYVAGTGYDNSTGWGSLNGANLFADLTVFPVPPAGPLAAPTGLTARAVNGTVNLSWKASYLATSYSVYRGSSPGAEGSTPIASGLTATSFADSVPNGITFYYKVSATNVTGTSELSNEISATPVALSLPDTPTNLTVAWVNGAMNLSWNASAGATSYNLYRGKTAGGESMVPVNGAVGISATNYTDRVTGGAQYYYRVAAVNLAGTSGLSNEVTLPEVMYPPTGATMATPPTSLNGIIEFNWSLGGIFPPTGDINYDPSVVVILEESLNGGAFLPVFTGHTTNATLQVASSGTYAYRIKSHLAGYTDSTYAFPININGNNRCEVTLTATPPPVLTINYPTSTGTLMPQWGVGGATNNPKIPAATYVLQYSTDGSNWTTTYTGTARYANVSFPASGTYTFRVKATLPGTGWLDSPWTYGSQQCVVTLTCLPSAHLIITYPTSTGPVMPNWYASPTPGVTYVLQYSTNGVNWTTAYTGTARYANLVMPVSGTYTFRIKATLSGRLDSTWTYGSQQCVVTR
jgi:kumamolisin